MSDVFNGISLCVRIPRSHSRMRPPRCRWGYKVTGDLITNDNVKTPCRSRKTRRPRLQGFIGESRDHCADGALKCCVVISQVLSPQSCDGCSRVTSQLLFSSSPHWVTVTFVESVMAKWNKYSAWAQLNVVRSSPEVADRGCGLLGVAEVTSHRIGSLMIWTW